MKKNIKLIITALIIMIIIILIISILIIKNTLSISANIIFKTDIYKIENNYIKEISPYTTIDKFKEYFDTSNCTIKIVDKNNQEITTKYIYTGSITQVYNNNNNIIYTYENIVTGDITEDGEVNTNDIKQLSKIIIENETLPQSKIIAMDLNNDNAIKINDLTILEEYLNYEYNTITLNNEELNLMTSEKERIIAKLNPSIILNQNVTWTSNNETVAKVTQTGIVTAYEEGNATITATTPDGKISKEVNVIVDNTIKLSSTQGTLYTGGDEVETNIKSLNYDNLTCTSSNNNIVTCRIENKKLILKPTTQSGTARVTVNSPEYGEATYTANNLITYLNVLPHSYCFKPKQGYGGGIISGFNFGELSVKSISDNEIVEYASITRSSISITSGVKTGDATVIFTESNGHSESYFTAHVYRLEFKNQISSVIIGEESQVEIINENSGTLTCRSSDEETATCTIENNILKITPIKEGDITITVTGSNCGSITTTINIKGSDTR